MPPPLSVLMPVFNTGKFVAKAAQSILNQTFRNFEFIIIDDGSTDDSVKILQRLAAQDRRITLITRPNRGLVDTRNELLHAAQSDLIAWADSDDRYHPHRLARQLERFTHEPDLVALGTAWQLIDADDLPIKTLSFPEHHAEVARMMIDIDNAMWFPTIMMKRRPAIDVGGFRHPFIIAEDYDLNLRLSEIGKVGNLPDLLCYYRQHFTSTVNSRHGQAPSYSRLANQLAHERRLTGSDRLQRGEKIDLHLGDAMTGSQIKEFLRLKWGWWALNEGHLHTARKHAALNTTEQPLNVESWRLLYCAIRGW